MQLINIEAQDIFFALGDLTCLRIMRLLVKTNEEACLCELMDSLSEPQYKLSRHLKILRQLGVKYGKRWALGSPSFGFN